MKSTQFLLRTAALSLLLPAALAQAATVTGTVTDKTTNKPAAGGHRRAGGRAGQHGRSGQG